MRSHLIATGCNARCEEFLEHHWLKSLRDNVNLKDVQVGVIDLGLTPACRQRLEAKDVLVFREDGPGHPSTARFRGMAHLLAEHEFDQVLMTDAGDVIFQDDIRPLLDENQDCWRAVCESDAIPLHELPLVFPVEAYGEDGLAEVTRFLDGKPVINVGMLVGPADNYAALWSQLEEFFEDYSTFGVDQPAINYFMYQTGFVELPKQYNYVLLTADEKYRIEDGVFYDPQGEVIPIVHNAGMHDALRAVHRFGYGPDYNVPKRILPVLKNCADAVIRFVKKVSPARRKQLGGAATQAG